MPDHKSTLGEYFNYLIHLCVQICCKGEFFFLLKLYVHIYVDDIYVYIYINICPKTIVRTKLQKRITINRVDIFKCVL